MQQLLRDQTVCLPRRRCSWLLCMILQLFLAELEVSQANEVIHRLDLQSLPHIFHIAASSNLEGDGKIKIPAEDVMQVLELVMHLELVHDPPELDP